MQFTGLIMALLSGLISVFDSHDFSTSQTNIGYLPIYWCKLLPFKYGQLNYSLFNYRSSCKVLDLVHIGFISQVYPWEEQKWAKKLLLFFFFWFDLMIDWNDKLKPKTKIVRIERVYVGCDCGHCQSQIPRLSFAWKAQPF